jgi:ferredoxin
MALIITDECICCDACVAECPNEAISICEQMYYIHIDPEKCTECMGLYDEPQCADVCPVDCCLPNPDYQETQSELLMKAERLKVSRVA